MPYRRIIIFLLLLGFTLIFGITIDAAQKKSITPTIKKIEKQKQKKTKTKIISLPTCKASGCNAEICSDVPMFSPCWVLPEHACYKTYGTCTRLKNGNCGWIESKKLLACLKQKHNPAKQQSSIVIPNKKLSMEISSPAFAQNGSIPAKYTCDGSHINPPLDFSGVPADTKSLVLLMDDPDVPKSIRPDGMWDHWVAWNVPPTTLTLKEGEMPQGIVGKNSGGENAYYPPCPPDGEHRYFFKLYALDIMLDLPAGSSKADVVRMMQGNILAQAELVGRYNRR